MDNGVGGVGRLRYIFNPSSVAVVGASEKPGTVGRAIMENLVKRFKGMVYPVNVKYDEVFGIKCYKRVLDIGERVDLAVIAVPARSVIDVLRDAGERGVKAAIVVSAGFKEVGDTGKVLEEKLVALAREMGIRVLGPNCLGVYDAYTGLDTIFNPDDRQAKLGPGPVAFISQSGALGAAVLDWLAEAGVGLSKFVSYGNVADIKEWELIEYLVTDDNTKVILVYIEGVEDGWKFMRSVRNSVRAGKPVVVLKAGKSLRGAQAASSHTGSLAGRYEVYEAALRQVGAIVVNELSELVSAAKALSWLPAPRGGRVAIVTNGGGAGVLATDALELQGLTMATLSRKTRERLKAELPPAASISNPVDILGDAPPERYEAAVNIVLEDEGVDAVVVIGIMQSPAFIPGKVLKVLKDAKVFGKPLVFVGPGGSYSDRHLKMIEEEAKVPSFKTPEDAVRALKYLVRWSEVRRKHCVR